MSVDLPLYQPDWPPARPYVLELEGEQSVHWALIGHIPHLEGVPNVLEAQKTLREELMGVLHTHKHIYDKHTDAYRHKTCQHEQKCLSTHIFYIRWALQWYGLQCHQKLYTWELIKFIVSDFMCVFSHVLWVPLEFLVAQGDAVLQLHQHCRLQLPVRGFPQAPETHKGAMERESGVRGVFMFVFMGSFMSVCKCAFVCMGVCLYVSECVCVCMWLYVSLCARVCVCVCERVYVSVSVSVCVCVYLPEEQCWGLLPPCLLLQEQLDAEGLQSEQTLQGGVDIAGLSEVRQPEREENKPESQTQTAKSYSSKHHACT